MSGSTKARLLIVGATLAVYSTTLGAGFYFDDYSLLTDPAVVDDSAWRELLDPARTRPLTYLTFRLNYLLGGADPAGYHLLNVLLFAALVWAAISVFERVEAERAAWAAGAVFALHPLATEPVAYVFGRASVLAAGLAALSWGAWIEGRRWRAVAWFAAALAAKEEAAALPLFLFLHEMFARSRSRQQLKATAGPLAAMAGVVAVFAAKLLYAARVTPGAGAAVDLGEITPWTYFWTQGKAIWLYLRLWIVPVGQSFDHELTLSAGPDWKSAAACGGLATLAAVSLWMARRDGRWFWLAGGLVLLIPTSTVVPLADLAAERRMLLPMLSFSLAAGCLVAALPRRAYSPALIGLGVLLGSATIARLEVWSSEEALWRDTVTSSPFKIRPKLQLARATPSKEGRLILLNEARNLAPQDADVLAELGLFYLDGGDPARAASLFAEARAARPNDPQLAANLGAALLLAGRGAEAEQAFGEALRLDPCNFDARNNLLLTLRARGAAAPAEVARPPGDCRWSPDQRRAFGLE